MKAALIFLSGIVTGVMVVIGFQFSWGVMQQAATVSSIQEGPAGGGFYRGAIPDFSVRPTSGNIFEYIDPEWVLINRKNEEIYFRSLEGKVLFINRWATWCGPCIAEMPDISELESRFEGEELEVLLVSSEQKMIFDAFENKHNVPLYLSRGKVPVVLNGKGLPSSFIVDKKGIIRYQHAGPAEWSHESVIGFIDNLLSEE